MEILQQSLYTAFRDAAILLFLAVPLSVSYRLLKTTAKASNSYISTSAVRQLTAAHAFATEGLQLLVAVSCAYHIASLPCMSRHVYSRYDKDTCYGLVSRSVALALITTVHIPAVYGVDLVEGRVLLGRWGHPYRWRCFIITRCVLSSAMRDRKPTSTKSAAQHRTSPVAMKKRKVARRHSTGSFDRFCKQQEGLEHLDLALGTKAAAASNNIIVDESTATHTLDKAKTTTPVKKHESPTKQLLTPPETSPTEHVHRGASDRDVGGSKDCEDKVVRLIDFWDSKAGSSSVLESSQSSAGVPV